MRHVLALVLLTTVLCAASASHAQEPALPRVLRAALGPLPRMRSALPVRWPRAPLDGPAAGFADDVAARLVRLPELATDAGQGATVCVIDTGADLTHAALRTPTGRTRVRALLDLDAGPRGSGSAEATALEADFGAAVWDSAAIDAALALDDGAALPRDNYGHGTAVAALAVGDELGVAQGAELVVVRALRAEVPGFRDEDLALGAEFCARASRDPARTVVLLALGGHDGAHDGSEPIERALASFPGLVVTAAGNDGEQAVHARALLFGGEVRIVVRVPSPSRMTTTEQHVALAVSLSALGGAPLALEVALEAPDGTVTAWTTPDTTSVADSPSAVLTLDGDAPARAGGTRVVYALISGGGELRSPLGGGVYSLRVRGRGRVDVWLAGSELTGALFAPRLEGPLVDDHTSVTIPGTAPELVTVGAITSRVAVDALAREQEVTGLPAAFTSVGPTSSGAPKPDVAAPGTLVVTALSRDVRAGERNLLGGSAAALAARSLGDGRVALDGSSYAAAFVAGALALALAEAPARGEEDRAILASTASRISPEAWDSRAGMGIMDITRFLSARRARLAAGPTRALLDTAKSRASFTRSLTTEGATDVFVVARLVDLDGLPRSRGSVVLTREGREVLTLPVIDGVARGAVPGAALVPGTLRFEMCVDDDSTLGKLSLHVAAQDDGARIAVARGGGCAALPGSVPMPWSVVLALFTLLYARPKGLSVGASRLRLHPDSMETAARRALRTHGLSCKDGCVTGRPRAPAAVPVLAAVIISVHLSLVPSTALAHPLIDQGRRSYDEADFQGALDAFSRAEQATDLTRDDLIQLYLRRAMVHQAMHNTESVEADVFRLAALDRAVRLPPSMPPPVRRAYEQAVARATAPMTLTVEVRAMPGGLKLIARIADDNAALVQSLRIRARPRGGAWQWSSTASIEVTTAADAQVDYVAQAVGPGGVVLVTAQSDSHPLQDDSTAAHEGGTASPSRTDSRAIPDLDVEPPADHGLGAWPWLVGGGAVVIAVTVVLVLVLASSNGAQPISGPMITF